MIGLCLERATLVRLGKGMSKRGMTRNNVPRECVTNPAVPSFESLEKKKRVRHLFQLSFISISAERGGFEPPKPFRGLHAFQACQFSHSCTFPDAGTNIEIIFVSSRIFLSIFNWKSKTIFLTGRINSTISPEGT